MRAWRTVGLTLAASAVAQAFGRFTYALLLPAIQRDLDISYTLAGTIGSANLFAYLAGSIAASYASTRLTPTTIIKYGIALSTIGLAMAWWAPSLTWLFIAMIIAGFAGAVIWIPAPGVAGASVEPARRGFATGLTGAGIGVGVVIASLVASLTRSSQGDAGWRTVYGVEAAIGIVVFAAVVTWLRSDATGPSERVRLSSVRMVPGWLQLLGGYMSFGLAYALFTIFLVASLEEDLGWSAASASTMFLVLGIATIPGGISYGVLSDRIGRRPAMVLGYAGMAVGALLVRVPITAVGVAAVVIFGLSFSGVPTVIAATVSDSVDARRFGAAFGAITVFFGISQIIAPQLGGWLFDSTGSFAVVYWASAATAVVGAVFSWNLPRRSDPAKGTDLSKVSP